MASAPILLFLLPALAAAHMTLSYPIPLNHPKNPFTTGGGDYDYRSPLAQNGSNYPCKGYQKLLGTPPGSSVASWEAGSSQSFAVSGTAMHGGGSCQASISEDGGQTFKVLKSYIGNCPVPDTPFPFVVPQEAKAGSAVFAWTWFNNLGNREMYMNCASITITTGASASGGGTGLGPSYPEVFKANIGNGCSSVPSRDLLFPDPGSFVSIASPNAILPEGDCGGGGGGGGGGEGSSGAPSVSSSASSNPQVSTGTAYPPTLVAPTTAAASPSPSSAPAAATTATLSTTSAEATAAAPSGCMCICNSGSGYTVNILPAPSIGAVLSNATVARPSVFVFSQATAGDPSASTGTKSGTRTSTMTMTRTRTRTAIPTSTPSEGAQTANCVASTAIPERYRRE